MKKLVIIVFIGIGLLFSGCSKWLEVQPQGQTTEGIIFNTQQGFKDALIGAYVRLNSTNLYGESLSYGFIEYLALNWDVTSNQSDLTNTALRNGNYNDLGVRGKIDNVFGHQYKLVLDVNGILANIDAKQGIFEKNIYEIIKGEALGLRALAHFDAIRLFGPVPTNPGDKKWLPYVKVISKNIGPGLTFQEFMQEVLADLNEAEALLAKADPLQKYTLQQLANDKNLDDFFKYRETRINYYAILALKARVFQWLAAGNPQYAQDAVKYAKLVLDGQVDGQKHFRLGTEADRATQNYVMTPEIIFAAYNELNDGGEAKFGENGNYFRADSKSGTDFVYLSMLFPAAERTSDIRYKEMWVGKTKVGSENYVYYRKYFQNMLNLETPINRIPIIRLSEMYFILTEFATSKAEADQYYRIYCDAKGIPFASTGFNASNWENDRRTKLIREVVREFYAEGKAFFNYKRLNMAASPAQYTYTYFIGSEKKYILPKPDREIDYNKL
ncbi:RagB/SusD family nutrient uptake outer membrane protein [Sphingobacterium sp. Mn56C]|uniref:RagB/SusD family nutrient uptake outer membrane protein n=1 Tax=Sphingobacterium sp. Mn56C TaxID=3395261 RepID=UPI003BDF5B20